MTLKRPDRAPKLFEAVAADLRDSVDGEIRFDPGSRATYSTDASNYRQVPIGVVVPRTGRRGQRHQRVPPPRPAGVVPRRRHQSGRAVL